MSLAGMPVLYWFSRRMSLWGTISFNLAVFINLIVAFFYPYDSGQGTNVNTISTPAITFTFTAALVQTQCSENRDVINKFYVAP